MKGSEWERVCEYKVCLKKKTKIRVLATSWKWESPQKVVVWVPLMQITLHCNHYTYSLFLSHCENSSQVTHLPYPSSPFFLFLLSCFIWHLSFHLLLNDMGTLHMGHHIYYGFGVKRHSCHLGIDFDCNR